MTGCICEGELTNMLVGWTDKHGPAVYDGEHVTYMKKKRPVQHAPHHFFVLDEWVIMAVDRFVFFYKKQLSCRGLTDSTGLSPLRIMKQTNVV